MALDVWWDVFVVGMGAGESRVVWVWPGIVPVQFLFAFEMHGAVGFDWRQQAFGERRVASCDFVTICFNSPFFKIEQFVYTKHQVYPESQQASESRRVQSGWFEHERTEDNR